MALRLSALFRQVRSLLCRHGSEHKLSNPYMRCTSRGSSCNLSHRNGLLRPMLQLPFRQQQGAARPAASLLFRRPMLTMTMPLTLQQTRGDSDLVQPRPGVALVPAQAAAAWQQPPPREQLGGQQKLQGALQSQARAVQTATRSWMTTTTLRAAAQLTATATATATEMQAFGMSAVQQQATAGAMPSGAPRRVALLLRLLVLITMMMIFTGKALRRARRVAGSSQPAQLLQVQGAHPRQQAAIPAAARGLSCSNMLPLVAAQSLLAAAMVISMAMTTVTVIATGTMGILACTMAARTRTLRMVTALLLAAAERWQGCMALAIATTKLFWSEPATVQLLVLTIVLQGLCLRSSRCLHQHTAGAVLPLHTRLQLLLQASPLRLRAHVAGLCFVALAAE